MSANFDSQSSVFVKSSDKELVEIQLSGSLDPSTVEPAWTETEKLIKNTAPLKVIIDSAKLTYADTPGITYFIKLRDLSAKMGFDYELINLAPEYQKLVNLFDKYVNEKKPNIAESENFIVRLGQSVVDGYNRIFESVSFIGEVMVGFLRYFINPSKNLTDTEKRAAYEKAQADKRQCEPCA